MRNNQHNYKIIGMALMGIGLLLLGFAAWVFLPKPETSAATNKAEISAIPAVAAYKAPELSLSDLDGIPVSLTDFAGQVVLVNNWATWCPPCKAEMPTLQAYYEDHHDQGFTIVAIEAGDSREAVVDFVDKYSLTFPVWPDLEQKALDAFRNPNLPNSAVIDRHGAVRYVWTGTISRNVLEEYVTPLMEE
jgi:cytochrome c biogenesis protein CcmG/thiol:disulfide interchange protein DsbE